MALSKIKTRWIEITIVIILLALISVCFAAFDATKPADSDPIANWPTLIRTNWDALEAALGVGLIYAPINDQRVNVQNAPYNATGNGVADDTVAIQAAIDAAYAIWNADNSRLFPEVYFPPGKYMVSNLILTSPCTLVGSAEKHPILYMIVGSVGNMIEDNGNAQGITIRNLSLRGQSCNASGIVLGFNTYPHGSGALLRDLVIRNFQNYGLHVLGNAARYENIICTGLNAGDDTKIRIDGTASRCWGLEHLAQDSDYGIEMVGSGNIYVGTHTEGHYTTGAILVDEYNAILNGTTITVCTGDTLPAAVVFASNAYGSQINGLSVIKHATATVTTCIIDNTYAAGMRNFNGERGVSDDYSFIDHYTSGREPASVPIISTTTSVPTVGTWRKGDICSLREADYGEAMFSLCAASGTPGTWIPMNTAPGAIAKAANYPIVVATDNGKRFSNEGAGGAITIDLPAATVGQTYHFIRIASQNIRIDPDGAETIRGGGAGEYAQLDADGDNMTIMCFEAGNWEIISYRGTITFH